MGKGLRDCSARSRGCLRTKPGRLVIFPIKWCIGILSFFTSPECSFVTQSQVYSCISCKKQEGGGEDAFIFCQSSAYLPHSQPERQWIYKFSCDGLISPMQLAATWDVGYSIFKRPQERLCSLAQLPDTGAFCWAPHEWSREGVTGNWACRSTPPLTSLYSAALPHLHFYLNPS